MFTGIVEEKGSVMQILQGAQAITFQIRARRILEDVQLGDSIAVNGVCLTVTNIGKECFYADAVHETLRRSSLGNLAAGSPVNLERALQLSTRLGGHIVSGHVDCTGIIKKIYRDGLAVVMEIMIPTEYIQYMIKKGSVTIEGISLTIAQLKKDRIVLSLIPHTMANTTLEDMKIGQMVNIETDIIGKYVYRFMETHDNAPEKKKSSLEELLKNGW